MEGDLKKAIEWIETDLTADVMGKYHGYPDEYSAKVVALTALKEKVERSKGCKWCQIIKEAGLNVENEPEINFCAHCGKEYEEEKKGEQ